MKNDPEFQCEAERIRQFDSPELAISFFHQLITLIRLVDQWENYVENHTEFTLTDENGNPIKTLALEKHYIKSVIPGPPNPAENGGDWVKIQLLEMPNLTSSSFLMRLNPSPSPCNTDDHTTHFYSSTSFVQLRVELDNNKVTALVETTELSPNIGKEAGFRQSIRNTGVALAGKLGFSAMHWNDLLNGWWESLN